MISTHASFRGKEVRRQPVRLALIGLAVIAGLLAGLLAGSVLLVAVALAPVLVLVHFALRAAGRRGFYRQEREDGRLSVNIDITGNSFKRR